MHIIDFSISMIIDIRIFVLNVCTTPTPPDRELQQEEDPEIAQSHCRQVIKTK